MNDGKSLTWLSPNLSFEWIGLLFENSGILVSRISQFVGHMCEWWHGPLEKAVTLWCGEHFHYIGRHEKPLEIEQDWKTLQEMVTFVISPL